MIRLFPAAASLAASLLLVVAASDANAQGAHYVAVPETAAKPSVITRSTAWTLRGDRYVANRAPERDLILCQLLARDVGPLKSFTAGGAALDGDKLDKCNARAKKGTAVATAAR